MKPVNSSLECPRSGNKSPDFAGWVNATVKLSETYYDLNDQVTAYAYDVIINRELCRIYLVSATTDKYPVLEISKGKLPGDISVNALNSEQSAKNFASEKGLPFLNPNLYIWGLYRIIKNIQLVTRTGLIEPDILWMSTQVRL